MKVITNKYMPPEYFEQQRGQSQENPVPAHQNEQQVQKLTSKERAGIQCETVKEAPAFKRQLLFMKPFTVYKDIFFANDKTAGKQLTDIPASYVILQEASKGQFINIGNADGTSIGWIRADEKVGKEWNVKGYLTPNVLAWDLQDRRPVLRPRPSHDAPSVLIDFSATTRFPILEKKVIDGDDWYRVMVPVLDECRTSKQIPSAVWISDRNKNDQVVSLKNICTSEKDLRNFKAGFTLIVGQFQLLSPTERKTCGNLFNSMKNLFLQLYGASSHGLQRDEGRGKAADYTGSLGLGNSFLYLTLDDIVRMDDQAYKEFLNRLIVCQKRVEELLGNIGGQKDESFSMNVGGEKTRMIPLAIDQLP